MRELNPSFMLFSSIFLMCPIVFWFFWQDEGPLHYVAYIALICFYFPIAWFAKKVASEVYVRNVKADYKGEMKKFAMFFSGKNFTMIIAFVVSFAGLSYLMYLPKGVEIFFAPLVLVIFVLVRSKISKNTNNTLNSQRLPIFVGAVIASVIMLILQYFQAPSLEAPSLEEFKTYYEGGDGFLDTLSYTYCLLGIPLKYIENFFNISILSSISAFLGMLAFYFDLFIGLSAVAEKYPPDNNIDSKGSKNLLIAIGVLVAILSIFVMVKEAPRVGQIDGRDIEKMGEALAPEVMDRARKAEEKARETIEEIRCRNENRGGSALNYLTFGWYPDPCN